jgi:hypothetical protein
MKDITKLEDMFTRSMYLNRTSCIMLKTPGNPEVKLSIENAELLIEDLQHAIKRYATVHPAAYTNRLQAYVDSIAYKF